MDYVLTTVVRPAVAASRAAHRVERFFFIRYWLEGPHLRLRTAGTRAGHMEMMESIQAGIEVPHPTMDRGDAEYTSVRRHYRDSQDALRQLFEFEYPEIPYGRLYGSGGIPLRNRLEFVSMPYVPDFDRFGGSAGVQLAEWHFEVCSGLVLELLITVNSDLDRLQIALNYGASLAVSLFKDDRDVRRMFARIASGWSRLVANRPAHPGKVVDLDRFRRIEFSSRPASHHLLQWMSHCAKLAGRANFYNADEYMHFGAVLFHLFCNRLGISAEGELSIARILQQA